MSATLPFLRFSRRIIHCSYHFTSLPFLQSISFLPPIISMKLTSFLLWIPAGLYPLFQGYTSKLNFQMCSWKSGHPTQSSLRLGCDWPAWSAEPNVIVQGICERNVLEKERPIFPTYYFTTVRLHCKPTCHSTVPHNLCRDSCYPPTVWNQVLQRSQLTLLQWHALGHWVIL